MGTYITSQDVWKQFGTDAFTKVTGAALGTMNGVIGTWQFAHDKLVSGSTTIYTGGTADTTGVINLDEGEITGLTGNSGNAVTADYWYADVEDSKVQGLINGAESQMETMTGRTFGTTSTTEFIDVVDNENEYFTQNYPVITFSSMQVNTASTLGDTPSYSTSTQGLGNDFISNTEDLKAGRFQFIDNLPPYSGRDRIKVTYTHGYTTTQGGYYLAQELATLLTMRTMTNSAIYKAIFKGQDNFSPTRLAELDDRITELTNLLKSQNIERILACRFWFGIAMHRHVQKTIPLWKSNAYRNSCEVAYQIVEYVLVGYNGNIIVRRSQGAKDL